MVAIGKSTGKIILMGEHAVVYGQPAIAMPFSAVEITARVSEQGEALSVRCDFYQGLVHEMPKIWESLKHAIRFSLYRLQAPTDPPLHIDISSTIPAERGMGSSAAVAAAVARALFCFYQTPLSSKELWEIVQSSEKIAHGNPSGIDATTVTGNSPVFFIKGEPIDPLALRLDAYLIVADTGKTGNTLEAITDVALLYQRRKDVRHWIDSLGALTLQARDYLADNQPVSLGSVMNQAQDYLQALGVSDEQLDTLVSVARQSGALGAKLTGGGRGGCMIALARNQKEAQKIAIALEKSGARQTWLQYLGER